MSSADPSHSGERRERLETRLPYNSQALIWLLIICAAVGLRWAFHGRYLEGWDSVNFALGVLRFDPLHHQPHFPGYPVYIAAAKLFHALGADPVTALALTSAAGGGLAALPLMIITKEVFDFRTSAIAGLLYATNPLLWLESEKVFSDAFGLFPLLSALAFTARSSRDTRFLYGAGFMMGLTLGVRLSYFPFVLTLLAACGIRRTDPNSSRPFKSFSRIINGGILGVGVWALPLLSRYPSQALLSAGEGHMEGHFTQWGGSAVTDPGVFHRLSVFLWNMLPNGLGTWWPDAPQPFIRLLLTPVILIALWRGTNELRRSGWAAPYLWAFLPYAIWVFFGQNLMSVRHVLPLIALLMPIIAAGLHPVFDPGVRQQPSSPLTGTQVVRQYSGAKQLLPAITFILLSMSVALPLVREYSAKPPTRIQAAEHLRAHYDAGSTWVLTWNSARVLEWYAPEWAGRVIAKPPKSLQPHERLLVLSDYPDINAVQEAGYRTTRQRVFQRNRYLHTWFHELSLWEATK